MAELKQLVNRPDVVEMHDVTARDPKLLVQLKAHRNTVQVILLLLKNSKYNDLFHFFVARFQDTGVLNVNIFKGKEV